MIPAAAAVPSCSAGPWHRSSAVSLSVRHDGSRRLSAPAEPSDSGTEGSQAGRGQASGATQPACRRAHDSAGDMADPGGGSKLQSLPYLKGKCHTSLRENCRYRFTKH